MFGTKLEFRTFFSSVKGSERNSDSLSLPRNGSKWNSEPFLFRCFEEYFFSRKLATLIGSHLASSSAKKIPTGDLLTGITNSSMEELMDGLCQCQGTNPSGYQSFRVRNRIPDFFLSFCEGLERNSERFSLPWNGSKQSFERFLFRKTDVIPTENS